MPPIIFSVVCMTFSVVKRDVKKNSDRIERTPGNGRGGLGRIRTDFVEFLKKGQEPIRTKFHFFLKQPLSGRKSNFQDKCDDFISDRATVILEKNVTKNRPDIVMPRLSPAR